MIEMIPTKIDVNPIIFANTSLINIFEDNVEKCRFVIKKPTPIIVMLVRIHAK